MSTRPKCEGASGVGHFPPNTPPVEVNGAADRRRHANHFALTVQMDFQKTTRGSLRPA
jgi:hypothetical protein